MHSLTGNLHTPSSCITTAYTSFNDSSELTRWGCSHSVGLIRTSKMLQWPKLDWKLHKLHNLALKTNGDSGGSFSFSQLQHPLKQKTLLRRLWRHEEFKWNNRKIILVEKTSEVYTDGLYIMQECPASAFILLY